VTQSRCPAMKKSRFSVSAALVLTLSLVFLQEGFTYYVSFQILALVTIAILIFLTTYAIKDEKHFFVAFLVFLLSVATTGVVSPNIIDRNSSNISLTVIGILAYAVMIGCMPNLKIKRVGLILYVLKYASSATVFVLAGLIALCEFELVPLLTRESMLQQNVRLIDNFTSAEALSADVEFRSLTLEPPKIDLFYGEPSFLAIVLFTCLGCYMLTSKLVAAIRNGSKYTYLKASFKSYIILVFGIMSLLYIQSLSSIIFALIVIYFVLLKGRITWAKLWTSISYLIIFAIAFLVFSYEYFLYRITQADSLSFYHRFGFLLDIGIADLLLGIKDASMLPDVGIHNGLFYIIAISGFGGVLYIISLLYSVYTLSAPIKSSMFSVLLVLAIMMQNGGVFSPNKVVLFSFILLPLACARSIYSGQRTASINSRHYE